MPVVDPGQPTSVGSWRAANSGSADPAVLRDRITPPFGTGVELYHWHDFTVDAPSAGGNLFDVVANVDWTHEEGQLVRESQAFYTGTGTDFTFRFGAEKLGRWTGVTSSAVPELDGLVLHATVTALTNPNRSGFHSYSPLEPTWWLQQKGASGIPVRIAPRFVMWDGVAHFWDDLTHLQDEIDLWSDTYGFTGANHNNVAHRWFDVTYLPSGNWELDTLTSNAVPDPRTFEALEQLIDRWLDKGGSVHIWQYADSFRDGAAVDLPGGEHGTLAQRIDRYISARLGPVPGWSLGYGFDLEEWTSAANIAQWVNRISTRIGWLHWIGGRVGNITTSIQTGSYPQFGINWNTGTNAPPQYASWEQWWPQIADREDPPATIISDIATNTAAGESAVSDRPPFSEDRFREQLADFGDKDFLDHAEVPTVIRAYGLAGWAAIYGNVVHDGSDNQDITSAEWSNPAAIKAANDEVTIAMEGS